MYSVKEVTKMLGISARTLHYYDEIGLLKPAEKSEAGYRKYSEKNIEELRYILLFRELGFSLLEISSLLKKDDKEKLEILRIQTEKLEQKKAHLEHLITLSKGISFIGVKHIDMKNFDVKKIDDYSEQAKALYGKTEAYREFEEKEKNRTESDNEALSEEMMDIFRRFGEIKESHPADSKEAQALVYELQSFITKHFYNCTKDILRGLGKLYSGGGAITDNIDKAGGIGTADYSANAIEIFCK